MEKEIIAKNEQETEELARELAREILKRKESEALVIGLEGDLGSGKTTFIQYLAKELGIKDKVTSPTFVIMKKYSLEKGDFYHIDCYRIESNDLMELGFKEIISQPNNIVVIEWAERVKDILSDNVVCMKFEHLKGDKRKILYENLSSN